MNTRKTIPFSVRSSAIEGRGAFATRRIRKGVRIIEYKGERVPNDVADRRYLNNGHHPILLFQVSGGITIDAGRGGNAARFINHSCDPNCETVEEDGHIFIEAIRNIQPGAELLYDYGLTGAAPRTKAEREYYECHCGSSKCRGTMINVTPKRRRPAKRKRVKSRSE